MNREQLEHAIRAVCTVTEDQEQIISGSQAILWQFPEAPAELRKSIEVDVSPKNRPEAVDKIDGALGENSQFHKTHGFYVHGVPMETAKLPKGWEKRTNKVQDYMDEQNIGHCIEAHEAASTLIAFREKDTESVQRLIFEEMIDVDILLKRLKFTDAEKEIKDLAIQWAERTAASL